MAYFKWRGVDLLGNIRKGKRFARSENDLNNQLIEQEISVISCVKSRQSFFSSFISLDLKIHFFRQLSVLLDSGVLLPDALNVLSSLINNRRLREVIIDVIDYVQEGESLSNSFKRYPEIFDSLMIRIVGVGQEAGELSLALDRLSNYLESTQSFRKKIKSAAMIPLVTFGFFTLVATIIFLFIVPRFELLFKSMKKELPYATKIIIKISQCMRSFYIYIFLVVLFLFGFFINRYMKTESGKKIIDKFVLHIPWFGDLVKNRSIVYFLYSISMLLNTGVRLLKAISISNKSVKNSVLQEQISSLEKEVASGISLSKSMKSLPGSLFGHDLIAIAKVGEESGRLGVMLEKGANIYQEKVDRSIAFFTTIFQPLLMIILGLLITLLIFAVYLPVFNLAHIL